jgi:hypothetical protein
MLRLVGLFLVCLTMFPAFGQSASKYKVGTITEVKVHQTAGSGTSDAVSYDVSLRVGDTVYRVLYTPPLGEETVKYVAGRDLLVLVGKNDYLQRHFGSIVCDTDREPETCREPWGVQIGLASSAVVI